MALLDAVYKAMAAASEEPRAASASVFEVGHGPFCVAWAFFSALDLIVEQLSTQCNPRPPRPLEAA